MNDLRAAALALHRNGRFAEAALLYEQRLARAPDDAEALHLLGVLRHQQGAHARAAELIERALVLQPPAAPWHANLAEVYRALRELPRALVCAQTAVRLAPASAEAWNNLGMVLTDLGRFTEAADAFRQAIGIAPAFALAHNNLGAALREQGSASEALQHFYGALELEPGNAAFGSNVGLVLLDLGRTTEALAFCQEAVRRRPDQAALQHNCGHVLRRLGRCAEARAAFLEALRLDPALAAAHVELGRTLQQEGQWEQALARVQRATVLEPEHPEHWEALAELHGERDEPDEALRCWQRALAVGPERASVHHGLGWALQEEGRWAEAAEHYRTAERLRPDLAMTQILRGGLHEEHGALAEAETCFRRAGQREPANPQALARLANLLRGRLPAADRAAVEERLRDATLSPLSRAHLLFAYAGVLDAQGDFGTAAASLREANALTGNHRPGRRYDPAEHTRFVESLIQTFTPDWFARLAGAGSASRRPVFVFGLPRSGTTLVEQILASHSQVFGAGELRLARQTFESLPTLIAGAGSPLEAVAHLDRSAVAPLAERHLVRLAEWDGGRSLRIVDKMVENHLYLGLLAALFPQAVFVHCRRDLRDVALSCWMTDFRSIRWANDPDHLAQRFAAYLRLMNHWRAVLPVPLHEVQYEETVADLEGTARRLVRACDLEWEPGCLEFHRAARPVRTASATQVRQPLYTHAVGRWRNYRVELSELWERLSPAEVAPTHG